MTQPAVRLAHDAADATWQGVATAVRMGHDAADATWQAQAVTAAIAITGPRGRMAAVGLPAVVTAAGLLAGPRGQVLARGAVPALGDVRIAGPRTRTAAVVRVPVLVQCSLAGPRTQPGVAVTVWRYELVGEVRDQGVLLNRRVRAYRRDTGALVTEADTSAGRFRLQVGFEPREHIVLPIHLDDAATDYAPPCANRVVSELAMDEVAA